jgi:hypothetical protein
MQPPVHKLGERHIDLVESLDGDWLKLPIAVMRDLGPAAQTLAGLLKVTNRETFVTAARIAELARVPLATCRKHLASLEAGGWIENAGRQKTRRGAPRRTCTIRITPKTLAVTKEYAVLPWWACCRIRGVGKLSWAAKALLGVIMAKLMAMKAAVQNGDGHGLDAGDLWGSLDKMGVEDRFCWSLSRIQRETGLSRDAAVAAKWELHRLRIVKLCGGIADNGSHRTDCLALHREFGVVVTPSGGGRCFVDLEGSRKVVTT